MARYLLVAHQTAESPELLEQARLLLQEDVEAEFVLLVPQTPVSHLVVWMEGPARQVALRRAEAAHRRLEEVGVTVVQAMIGDRNPLDAIATELRRQPDYAAIVICTLPPGISQWLKLDLVSQVRRQFRTHRIIHVTASASSLPA
jgi:hypothetical protein